ncbi:hypothetical protein Acsp01_23640 [Actinoplanes sp. NBRC 101535]|nr:hypothetical protein Acsp01_23640 [Actinoplanes sp. NBRC 101535]
MSAAKWVVNNADTISTVASTVAMVSSVLPPPAQVVAAAAGAVAAVAGAIDTANSCVTGGGGACAAGIMGMVPGVRQAKNAVRGAGGLAKAAKEAIKDLNKPGPKDLLDGQSYDDHMAVLGSRTKKEAAAAGTGTISVAAVYETRAGGRYPGYTGEIHRTTMKVPLPLRIYMCLVPRKRTKDVHSGCAETACLVKAYRHEGIRGLFGGKMRAMRIRPKNSTEGPSFAIPLCALMCQPRLRWLRIKWDQVK